MEKKWFVREIGPLIIQLSEISFAGIIHNLVKTLISLAQAEPVDVFLMMTQVVKAGEKGGYQFESLAADQIVNFVEGYLAEYRPIFRENDACQTALLDLLDIFVKAGWPSARRLTYGLEEIYR